MAITSPASALASSSSSPRTAPSRTLSGEHVHFGGSEPAFGLCELHGTLDDGAHGHLEAGYRHFVA